MATTDDDQLAVISASSSSQDDKSPYVMVPDPSPSPDGDGDEDGGGTVTIASTNETEGHEGDGDDDDDESTTNVLEEYAAQLPGIVSNLNRTNPSYFGNNPNAVTLQLLQSRLAPAAAVVTTTTTTTPVSPKEEKEEDINTTVSISGDTKTVVALSSSPMCIVCKKNAVTLKCEWCNKLLWCPLCKVIGKRDHEEECESF